MSLIQVDKDQIQSEETKMMKENKKGNILKDISQQSNGVQLAKNGQEVSTWWAMGGERGNLP